MTIITYLWWLISWITWKCPHTPHPMAPSVAALSIFMSLSFHPRKTPVHKLYSGIGRHLQSDGPTKGPTVLAQLPQGYHHLYAHIEYECTSPFYQHSGSSRRTCLKTGKWSGRHVSCSPGEGSRGPPIFWPLAKSYTHMIAKICDTESLCDHTDMISLQAFI